MNKILIISPDPETTKILRLRLEIEGIDVGTALGQKDAGESIKSQDTLLTIIDMVNFDEEEIKEVKEIIKSLNQKKMCSILLLPRAAQNTNIPKLPPVNLVMRKPYDLNVLVQEIQRMINIPKTS